MKNNDNVANNLKFDTLTVTYNSSDPAVITIYPLERGFGHTLGRLITASLEKASLAAAICAYMSDGSVNEEDLIYSLRNVRLKYDKGSIVASNLYILNVKDGYTGKLYAGDLKVPEGITICNPELEIVGAEKLKCVYVKTGRGFEAAEDIQHRLPKRATAIDVNHCLIERASYTVEATRSGSYIDRDKLTITVIPKEGYRVNDLISDIIAELKAILDVITSLTQTAQDTQVFYREEIPVTDRNLERQIDEVIPHLSVRASNAFRRNNIVTLDDLLNLKREGLERINGLGKITIDDITRQLEKQGYYI